jgi:nitronate monooxygenase
MKKRLFPSAADSSPSSLLASLRISFPFSQNIEFLEFGSHFLSSADNKPIISAIHSAREESGWAVKIWVQVGDLASAQEAIEQGTDVIVAQGVDAGGHQWAHGAGVVVLVPELGNLVNRMGKVDEVAVVAAGGIVDGSGVVAGLSLGVRQFRWSQLIDCSESSKLSLYIPKRKVGAQPLIRNLRSGSPGAERS